MTKIGKTRYRHCSLYITGHNTRKIFMDINLTKHGLLATFSSLINWKTSPYKYTKIGIITSHLKILILRCSVVKFINLEST